jgi:hypothetical protein
MIRYLGEPFSASNYEKFVRDLLKRVEIIPDNHFDVPSQYHDYVKMYRLHGYFKDSEGGKLAIISAKVHENSNARTAQRNFISWLLSKGDLNSYNAALVAFYDGVRTNWKLSYVSVDVALNENGIQFEYKPAKRFSFLVGEGEPVRTYTKQLTSIFEVKQAPKLQDLYIAFSVNKVTKDFYEEYYKKYHEFKLHLESNESFQIEAHRIGYRETKTFATIFAKKTLGQIVFLYFIQKKGWLGVELGHAWGTGNKRYLFDQTEKYKSKNFFNEFLEPLFYSGLNQKRPNDEFFGVQIPFLNGGLFHPLENYDWKKTDFSIPNDFWFNNSEIGFLDILNQYNFTIYESDPDEQEIAIDPEMLGRIFESLLDVDERQDKGAFYTPRTIVHYMCVESLARSISKELAIDYNSILNYILYNDALKEKETIEKCADIIDEYIANLAIVDPAVGSGAFLVGMLNEIVKLRLNLSKYMFDKKSRDKYTLKKHAIQNTLYGVDIEADAIEIAKLRLWLSLVVDQELMQDESPKPLPNLAFSLRVGNSLVDKFEGTQLWTPKWKKKKVSEQMDFFTYDETAPLFDNIKNQRNQYFVSTDEAEKIQLQNEIEESFFKLIRIELSAKKKQNLYAEILEMKKNKTKPYFLWDLEFSKVFEEKGGFDIVIANPPYIQLQKDGGKLANQLKDQGFTTFERTGDIYCLFYEQGINLLRKEGILAYISSNKWMRAGYGESLRAFFSTKANPIRLIDFAGQKIFEFATVDVNILVLEKDKNKGKTVACTIKEKFAGTLSNYLSENSIFDLPFNSTNGWVIMSALERSIKEKVEDKGIPLDQWKIKINRGILTGLNDAFIIDEQTKNRLIFEDPKSAEIIRPILRGRDIDKYSYSFSNTWLINSHNGIKEKNISPINIDDYPAIKRHFNAHKDELVKRQDQGDSPYNLRNCAYMEDFYEHKIAYPDISTKMAFSLVDPGVFLTNTAYYIKSSQFNKFFVLILNSKLIEWYYNFLSVQLGEKAIRMFSIYVKKIPIPIIDSKTLAVFNDLYDKLVASEGNSKIFWNINRSIESVINEIYGLEKEEIEFLCS